jgi:6-phosphogluconolactonase
MLTIDPNQIQPIDDRRQVIICRDSEETVRRAVELWIQTANRSIANCSRFAVALSGGSTPQSIYRMLASEPYAKQIDWSKVYLFWSHGEWIFPITHSPRSNFPHGGRKRD